MWLSAIIKAVPFALLVFPFQTSTAQTKSSQRPASSVAVVTVDVPTDELLLGYLRLEQQHPGVIPQPQHPLIPAPQQGALHSQSAATHSEAPPALKIPSLDLYSASGVSVYHDTDSEKNAAFIRGLPRSIRQAKTDEVRPTLREAMEMFTELKPYEAAPVSKHEYTVFVLTVPDKASCKAQNEAIQELTSRVGLDIRVIEVRLQK
jgi:hypothetical protein